jgi:hypothetical protein
MQDERSSVEADETRNDAAVLGLLLAEPGLWSVEEVVRAIGDELAVTDSLARLHGGGLVHRISGFVFATRAAVESARVAD